MASKRANVSRDEQTGDLAISGMSVKEAILALAKMAEQDEKEVGINVEFPEMYLTEGMIALATALEQRYGRFYGEDSVSFFGKNPPTLVTLDVAPGHTRQVLWGKFSIPGFSDIVLQTSMTKRQVTPDFAMPILCLQGKIKQKDKGEIDALTAYVKEVGRTQSIYKGKALELVFPDPKDPPSNPQDWAPRFMALGSAPEPVFDAETQAVIDNYIYEDIEATALTRSNGLPIKKGVLLEGPPGTGKTMLAHALAKKCEAYGWTFTYLRDVKDLAQAVALVQKTGWGPVFVFAEDVDRVVGVDRTDAVNDILNVIGGIEGEHHDIVVLFTTNDIDVIHKTMLRPGRLDVLISVHAPNALTVEQLVRREAGACLDYDENISAVGRELDGTMPAVVVQVVQRAKRAAQRRERLAGKDGKGSAITGVDLMVAAKSMRTHIERLKPVPEDERTPIEKAADSLAGALISVGGLPPYLPPADGASASPGRRLKALPGGVPTMKAVAD